jgi:hypothetical protein
MAAGPASMISELTTRLLTILLEIFSIATCECLTTRSRMRPKCAEFPLLDQHELDQPKEEAR